MNILVITLNEKRDQVVLTFMDNLAILIALLLILMLLTELKLLIPFCNATE